MVFAKQTLGETSKSIKLQTNIKNSFTIRRSLKRNNQCRYKLWRKPSYKPVIEAVMNDILVDVERHSIDFIDVLTK